MSDNTIPFAVALLVGLAVVAVAVTSGKRTVRPKPIHPQPRPPGVCKEVMTWNPVSASCICIRNSSINHDATGCTCNAGYTYDADTNQCIPVVKGQSQVMVSRPRLPPLNCPSSDGMYYSSSLDTCLCQPGYRPTSQGNTCQRK